MDSDRTLTHPATALASERHESDAFLPVWLIVLFFVLLFRGGVYFDQHSGWFDARVLARLTFTQRSVEAVLLEKRIDFRRERAREGQAGTLGDLTRTAARYG